MDTSGATQRLSKSQLTARNLLSFVIGVHGDGYTRERAAAAIEASLRTVDRALSRLIEIGALSRVRGGKSTPARLTILMDLDEFLAHQKKMAHQTLVLAHQTPKMAHQPIAYSLRNISKERKAPSMERRRTQNHRRGIGRVDPAELPAAEQRELEEFIRAHEGRAQRRTESRERVDLIASKALESNLRQAANTIINDAYLGPAAVQEKMF